MRHLLNHLRCHVFKCTKESLSLTHGVVSMFYTAAEITNLKSVILVHNQVFRLQISVHEAILVHKIYS